MKYLKIGIYLPINNLNKYNSTWKYLNYNEEKIMVRIFINGSVFIIHNVIIESLHNEEIKKFCPHMAGTMQSHMIEVQSQILMKHSQCDTGWQICLSSICHYHEICGHHRCKLIKLITMRLNISVIILLTDK